MELAVKVADKKKLDKNAISQFKYEASILYKCRHQNIVKCLEVFESEENIYMVTEFCQGGDLQQVMSDRDYQALDEKTTRSLAQKLGEAIRYLHDRNIVHRDIKPENILMSDVSENSTPFLADFEYAKMLGGGQTCSRLCGTKGYMAPEVLTSKPYSLPIDIWAFGILIYALVSC